MSGTEEEEFEIDHTCKKLQENDPTLTELEPSFLEDGPKSDWLKLMDALENNSTITKLAFYHSNLDDEVISGLGKYLKKTSKLEELTISNPKKITEFGVKNILNSITNNQNMILRKFGLTITKISHEICGDLHYAFKSLKKNLMELDLYKDDLEDTHSFALAELLKNNETLEVLHLTNNKLSDQGFRILFDSLEENTTLRKLDICGNKMKNIGMKYMLSLLEERSKKNEANMIIDYELRGLDSQGFKILF